MLRNRLYGKNRPGRKRAKLSSAKGLHLLAEVPPRALLYMWHMYTTASVADKAATLLKLALPA